MKDSGTDWGEDKSKPSHFGSRLTDSDPEMKHTKNITPTVKQGGGSILRQGNMNSMKIIGLL